MYAGVSIVPVLSMLSVLSVMIVVSVFSVFFCLYICIVSVVQCIFCLLCIWCVSVLSVVSVSNEISRAMLGSLHCSVLTCMLRLPCHLCAFCWISCVSCACKAPFRGKNPDYTSQNAYDVPE